MILSCNSSKTSFLVFGFKKIIFDGLEGIVLGQLLIECVGGL